MGGTDHSGLVAALLPAVLAAGRLEMQHYESDLDVERKADQSPVTGADRDAEALLIDALAKLEPGVPVVAEERAAGGCLPETGSVFFLVDPLDGTREFINKRDEFTINVALVLDRVPTLGIIYAPALQRLYVAPKQGEALEAAIAPDADFKSFDNGDFTGIRVREPDPASLVAFASRSHRSKATDAFLSKLQIAETKHTGSSLKFCLIARGDADLYPRLGPTCEWDTAAGHAILVAAGGSVVTMGGGRLLYGKRDEQFLNPHFVAWGGRALMPVGDATD